MGSEAIRMLRVWQKAATRSSSSAYQRVRTLVAGGRNPKESNLQIW